MEYEVRLSREAHNDAKEIIGYIINKLDNPIAAAELIRCLEITYDKIALNPYIYALCSDDRLHNLGYRKSVIKNYVMIYRIDEKSKTVYVVRIFYAKRNYLDLL